jgi:hypothetical protein
MHFVCESRGNPSIFVENDPGHRDLILGERIISRWPCLVAAAGKNHTVHFVYSFNQLLVTNPSHKKKYC